MNGGINTYGYVGGNPVNLFDPNGLFPTSCTGNPQAVMLCAGATTATGAAVGGATYAAVNIGTQAYNKGWDCIDWDEVGDKGLEGMYWGFVVSGGEAVALYRMGVGAPGVIAGVAGQAQKHSLGSSGITTSSVNSKLTNYLLNKSHPVGGSKAQWFDKALGYNQANYKQLSRQIIFNENKAVFTASTQYGQKFNQVIPIIGANGRTIEVTFAWIRGNDGIVRLVTAIPGRK